MAKIRRRKSEGKIPYQVVEASYQEAVNPTDARLILIQQLIPLGLEALNTLLQEEVSALAGSRYEHNEEQRYSRWGSNPGSVVLAGQKVALRVPRIRDTAERKEVPLSTYEKMKNRDNFDQEAFKLMLKGISCRDYEGAVQRVPDAFGMKKTKVSEGFKRASAKKLQELLERDLSQDDYVALIIDGKHLKDAQMLIAIGITVEGDKKVLGFTESNTESGLSCQQLMEELVARGLSRDKAILCVVDGSRGLRKGVVEVLGKKAVIQRCQWHKRENVVALLPKQLQGSFRQKLQAAYGQKTYEGAKRMLLALRRELALINESAARSLDEGFEETLTLHRLGLVEQLGRSLKTTNCIENVNRRLEDGLGRICKFVNSNQRQRWVASHLIEIEKSLNRIHGKQHLSLLRPRLDKLIQEEAVKSKKKKVA